MGPPNMHEAIRDITQYLVGITTTSDPIISTRGYLLLNTKSNGHRLKICPEVLDYYTFITAGNARFAT
ncbi:hypothetical protein XNC1_3770 [Xenorhabdus nematophila ATCC 19061]|uniref:Uncharacterized protein n=1 Tax=Xenorhabdus nematophila (strain ATCC 19061 / DSM 3370 / CCUG 14189 / LMG 1036 / NCIMB 9965 / AN6) TaxID=406817 RepID=D3VB26_XENNA|nr:hypothetical protein XNC1_3770 [Xenorhabdus nematophila ATCC 19061]